MEKCEYVSFIETFDAYPCTPLQSGMIARALKDPAAYTNQLVLDYPELMDKIKLENAIKTVSDAHDILRTSFVSLDRGIYQILRPKLAVAVSVSSDLNIYLQDDISRGFSLTEQTWFRVALINETGCSSKVVFTIHHVLYDGWCLGTILKDILDAYHGKHISKSATFKSVVEFIESQNVEQAETFWKNYLSNLEVFKGFGYVAPNTSDAGILKEKSVKMEDLKLVASKHRTTHANICKSAWSLCLKLFMQSSDVIFGNVISGRDIPVDNVETIVGPLINTVPCRIIIEKDMKLSKFIEMVAEDHAAVSEFSQFSVTSIQKWSSIGADQKIFNTLLAYESLPNMDVEEGKNSLSFKSAIESSGNFNEFDLQLALFPMGESLEIDLRYDNTVLNDAFARQVCTAFEDILTGLVKSLSTGGEETVGDLLRVSLKEQELLCQIGTGDVVELGYETAYGGFEYFAARCPEEVAIEYKDVRVTYRELDEQSNTLASVLSCFNLVPGDFVGILSVRSIEMISGMLATLKSGAAFVPIDSSIPFERIGYIIQHSNCKVVLYHEDVDKSLIEQIGESTATVCLSETSKDLFNSVEIDSDSPAYAVFTSGSTGKPKGVVVSHRSLTNFTTTKPNLLDVSLGTRVAQLASISFDMSLGEIFCTLNNGGRLILREEEDYFAAIRKANTIFTTPTALLKIDVNEYPDLQLVVVGGELFQSRVLDNWPSRVTLRHAYGPTEITIVSTAGDMLPTDEITIGRPLPNTVQYIVDKELNLVPFGVPGELVIGGTGVSMGYLNRPDLTAERFIQNSFTNDGGLIYRTGDLCRWTSEKKIQILGRLDDMVKVKGYRIELDEVSIAIISHNSVTAAKTIVKDDMLLSFVTPLTADIEQIRDMLSDKLPVYMIPSKFIALESFILNSNGKIDKAVLLNMKIDTSVELPIMTDEIEMADIWAKILKVDKSKIGRHSSFFELGGDSIIAIQLVMEVRRRGYELSTSTVFKASTLARMTDAMKANKISPLSKTLHIR
ncbi:hypothetical protein BC833DRAFT_533489 [Globomyces pollinis-pini]|nr:hypothetical protein BC833DRAFT_533489 [Globomyces pollinis-pini]